MPIFWWGLLLIMFFSVRLGWTPVSGRIDLINYYVRPADRLHADRRAAVRPARRVPSTRSRTSSCRRSCSAPIPLAVIARMTRSSMLEVLSEDYVRTARAKGAVAAPRRRRPRACATR